MEMGMDLTEPDDRPRHHPEVLDPGHPEGDMRVLPLPLPLSVGLPPPQPVEGPQEAPKPEPERPDLSEPERPDISTKVRPLLKALWYDDGSKDVTVVSSDFGRVRCHASILR